MRLLASYLLLLVLRGMVLLTQEAALWPARMFLAGSCYGQVFARNVVDCDKAALLLAVCELSEGGVLGSAWRGARHMLLGLLAVFLIGVWFMGWASKIVTA